MAWPKGVKRPAGAGRKKGTPNKNTLVLREAFRAILEEPAGIEQMRQKYVDGKLEAPVFLRLLEYVIGKPSDKLEHSGRIEIPVKFGGRYKPTD